MDALTFADLGLSDTLLTTVSELGFQQPSEIQAQAIPLVLSGVDIVGISQTGSGKTAAFALPALEKLDVNSKAVQVLVICPTRELAIQVAKDMERFGANMGGFRVSAVYGGASLERQLRELKRGVSVVVGTPGRLLDHMRRGSFNTKAVQTVILDEADRMLDMGFREEMEELLEQLPPKRQTLFFSATMNSAVEALIRKFGKEPQKIQVAAQNRAVETIEQGWFELRQRSRIEVFSRLLEMHKPRLCIAFANTKRVADEVCERLLARGYLADRLHGDCSQTLRERTLERFRKRDFQILVATDVAARGLDVDEIDLVINLELPQDAEDYVHRIGRTGRAGRSGLALSFASGRDVRKLSWIEKTIGEKIPKKTIPSLVEVEQSRQEKMLDLVKERLEKGDLEKYESLIQTLLQQEYAAEQLTSALFALLSEQNSFENKEIAEDFPERERSRSSARADRPERKRRNGNNAEEPRRTGRERRLKERGGDSSQREVQPLESGMARLFLNVGKQAKVKPKDLVGMFYNEGKLPARSLGKIVMFPKHSVVDVPENCAAEVIEKLRDGSVCGKKFKIDYDRRG